MNQIENKEVSDTPRTDAVEFACDEHDETPASYVARQLERELAAANERIKRLEKALRRLVESPDNRSLEDFTPEELEAWANAKAVLENKE